MTSVSAGHIILTPTQPVGSGRTQRESNPRPPHQESRALSTELPRLLQTEGKKDKEIGRQIDRWREKKQREKSESEGGGGEREQHSHRRKTAT